MLPVPTVTGVFSSIWYETAFQVPLAVSELPAGAIENWPFVRPVFQSIFGFLVSTTCMSYFCPLTVLATVVPSTFTLLALISWLAANDPLPVATVEVASEVEPLAASEVVNVASLVTFGVALEVGAVTVGVSCWTVAVVSTPAARDWTLAEVATAVCVVLFWLATGLAVLVEVALCVAAEAVEVDWLVEDAELASEVANWLVADELAPLVTCSVLVAFAGVVSADALTLANTKPAAKANVVAPA